MVKMIRCLLLTRKCNLHCSYCSIAGDIDYPGKPECYTSASYYLSHEQKVDYWIDVISRLVTILFT